MLKTFKCMCRFYVSPLEDITMTYQQTNIKYIQKSCITINESPFRNEWFLNWTKVNSQKTE